MKINIFFFQRTNFNKMLVSTSCHQTKQDEAFLHKNNNRKTCQYYIKTRFTKLLCTTSLDGIFYHCPYILRTGKIVIEAVIDQSGAMFIGNLRYVLSL